MTAAVAQMPGSLAGRGDASNDLLEALLASCQKTASAPPLAGFGRELVPYFSSPEDAKVTPKQSSRATNSPQRKGRKASALAAAMVAAAKKTPGKGLGPKANRLSAVQAEKARAVQMAALMSSWAGPGFCISPTPEKLPKPTAALLN